MSSTHLSLYYHIVFSTKGRRPLIEAALRDPLQGFVSAVVQRLHGVPGSIGGTADHIHILTGLRATHRLSDFIREVKSESSKWMHEQNQVPDFGWQDGYGAFTVSASQRQKVSDYIRNQEAHHQAVGFESEYLSLLQKSGVAYDDRYLW